MGLRSAWSTGHILGQPEVYSKTLNSTAKLWREGNLTSQLLTWSLEESESDETKSQSLASVSTKRCSNSCVWVSQLRLQNQCYSCSNRALPWHTQGPESNAQFWKQAWLSTRAGTEGTKADELGTRESITLYLYTRLKDFREGCCITAFSVAAKRHYDQDL